MGSAQPKVLLPVLGKPLISWVSETLRAGGVQQQCAVISPAGDAIRDLLGSSVQYAVQTEPRGSGDAAAAAAGVLEGKVDHVVVACGDSPLFRAQTVAAMIQKHLTSGAVVTLAAAELDDPSGYGRIIRSADGNVAGIVEERVATEAQRAVREINGGLYVFEAAWLWWRLKSSRQVSGEFVLTQLVAEAVAGGLRVATVPCGADEVAGANTPEQLRAAADTLRRRAAAND